MANSFLQKNIIYNESLVEHKKMHFNRGKLTYFQMVSTGERPFIDILQDRRYWLIHLITIPSLFLAGSIFILSGFVYKVFRIPNFNQYFQSEVLLKEISLINDRFSILNEFEDVFD